MWYDVKEHVQRVQIMYGNGGRESSRLRWGCPSLSILFALNRAFSGPFLDKIKFSCQKVYFTLDSTTSETMSYDFISDKKSIIDKVTKM